MTPTLHAEAADTVHALVHGPPRTGRVLAVTPYALYVATGRSDLPALAVLSPDAIRVPNALVLHPRTPLLPPGPRPGASAYYGAGGVTLGATRVTAAPTPWSPPRVHGLLARGARPDRLADLARALRTRPLDPSCAAPLADLEQALRTADPAATKRAAWALLGRGPGLTPSGDDILCGVLLAAHATGRPLHALARALEAPGTEQRTPLLSLSLLRHAARGECVPQAAAVLRGLGASAPLDATALFAVGHHSGTDLARGILAHRPHPPSPRPPVPAPP